MVRVDSVSMSPDVNATCTAPWGQTWTMNTQLRIVRSGSETMIVARPGRRAEAGMICAVLMGVIRSSG